MSMIVFDIGVRMEVLVWMRVMVTGECSNLDCIWAIQSLECHLLSKLWHLLFSYCRFERIFFFFSIKKFSLMCCKLPVSQRIHRHLLWRGHWLLCWPPLFRAQCLPGPAAQLYLPLHAWIWRVTLWTGNKWVQQLPLRKRCHLPRPNRWLSVPVPPRVWGYETSWCEYELVYSH